MTEELKTQLNEFIDALSTEYGDIVGFEVNLKEPLNNGKRQGFYNVEEFNLYYIHKTNLIK